MCYSKGDSGPRLKRLHEVLLMASKARRPPEAIRVLIISFQRLIAPFRRVKFSWL